jgi:hypothetical protein
MRVIVLSMLVAVVALFTLKPSRSDFDRELDSTLHAAITSVDPLHGKNIVDNLSAIGCKIRLDDCIAWLKKLYTVSSTDYVLASHYLVRGAGVEISCWGLLRQFLCDRTISAPSITDSAKKARESIFQSR